MVNKKNQVPIFLGIATLMVALSFLGGVLFQKLYYERTHQFHVLTEAYNILEEHAIQDLPSEQEMEYGMIRGMLGIYQEPYTVFVEPPQHELQSDQLAGKFGGIGIRIEIDTEANIVLYPVPGSPAELSGVMEGDVLLAVDDLQMNAEMTMDEIQAAIRGPVGQKVQLTILRKSNHQTENVQVKREEFPIPSVTYNLLQEDENIGVIHIHVIADTTPDEVKTAIQALQEKNASKFIIDLRDNPGGLVEAGVKTAGLFLPKCSIIEQQYRGKDSEIFENKTAGEYADLPIVLLVNKGSASAAEIFSGAIQAQKRALLIGTNTYGKDTIQLVFDLSDGSSLHVTAAKWWVPALGYTISENGLIPDILLSDEEINQPDIYQKAASYLRN